VSHVHLLKEQPLLIRVGYSLLPLRSRVEETAAVLLLAFPLGVGLAGFAGYQLARRALDPLAKMAARAELITATQLSQRLPVSNPSDELGHMAQVLNQLLARLEDSFTQLRRFTSDVSHELRTPLAAIRSVGEVGLQSDKSTAEYREIIGSMLEEVSRLTAMVESLLTISRADAGQISLQRSQFLLSDLIGEAAELVQILAEEKNQDLRVAVHENPQIVADRSLLRLAVVNLLHNAVRYSPESTAILAAISQVGTASGQTWAQLEVIDSGPGIPKNEQTKVFDRFYRLDASRSQEKGGTGLGLAIAKWAVEINGGRIGVQTTDRGSSRFFIQLPVPQLS
jgi:heavy metal sensor kinase